MRKHLAGIPLNQAGDESLYSPEMNEKTYQFLLELGLLLISQGFSVILDAKYDRHQWRSPIVNAAEKGDFFLKILHCQASIDTLKTRLQTRKGDISDATADLLAQQKANTDTFNEKEKKYAIAVNTEVENWQLGLDSWLN